MNNKLHRFSHSQAYTLMEITIGLGMLGIVGAVIFTVLNGGMILFAKNIATNHSNLTVRTSSMRLVQDLHDSVGRPQLAGLDLQPVVSNVIPPPPAPAIRFPQLLNPTASRVISDSNGSTTINSGLSTSNVSLRITQPTNPPRVGDILIFPDITDVSGNILTRTISAVTTGSPTVVTVRDLGVNLSISTATPPDPTIVYIARLAAYSVVTTATASNGIPTKTEVRFYPDVSNLNNYVVTNINLTTYLPPLDSGDYDPPYGNGTVDVPLGPFSLTTGSSDSGVAQVRLISINTDTGNRTFVGDRMVLNQIIPPKCLIIQSTNYN